MTKISRLGMGICAAICCVGFMSAVSYGAQPIKTYTKPCVDIILSFVRLGKISEIAVKDGDIVKPGDLLVQLDDSAEAAACERLKAKAEQDLPIREARAKLKQAELDLKKYERTSIRLQTKEREHAKLTVLLSEIGLEVAEFENAQNDRTLKEALVQLNLMKIKCPSSKYGNKESGFRVEQVIRKVGESVDRLDDVVRIVKLDPLWLDVDVPMEDFRKLGLKEGSKAQVSFCDTDTPVEGKVFFVAGVADYASDTRRVRVELPNPMGRPAGEHATVILMPSKSPKSASKPAPKVFLPKVSPKVIPKVMPKAAPKVKIPAPTATAMTESKSSKNDELGVLKVTTRPAAKPVSKK